MPRVPADSGTASRPGTTGTDTDPSKVRIAVTRPVPAKDTDRCFGAIEECEDFAIEDLRTIVEADVVSFAGVSDDFHPHHRSKGFATKESDFGGTGRPQKPDVRDHGGNRR